jgi:hypothetical protein
VGCARSDRGDQGALREHVPGTVPGTCPARARRRGVRPPRTGGTAVHSARYSSELKITGPTFASASDAASRSASRAFASASKSGNR